PSPRCLLRPRGGSTLFPYTTLFRSLNPGRPLGEKVRALVDAALAAAPLFSEPEPLVQLMTPAFVWLLEEGQIRGDLPRAEAVIDSLARPLAEGVAGAGFVLPGHGGGPAQARRR